MNIYHYHPETKQFIASGVADQSPLEPGVWLIPAYATNVEPPEAQEGKTIHCLGGEWVYQDVVVEVSEVPTPPTLAEIVSEKWNSIKAKRDSLRFDGGVKVNGHWFKSNITAIAEYNSILHLGLPDNYVLRPNWRTMDNGEVAMTPLLAKQIIQAGFVQTAAIDDAAQSHKLAIESSQDPASYDFSGGWPEVFEGPL
jgi:hypothetical protein